MAVEVEGMEFDLINLSYISLSIMGETLFCNLPVSLMNKEKRNTDNKDLITLLPGKGGKKQKQKAERVVNKH
eukprot:8449484-Ditylum_brightwellii.AAC.1